MTTLAQLEMIDAALPRNSKGFKRDLRAMAPKELRTLLRQAEKLDAVLMKLMAPIEDELMSKTGRFH